jgi:hypothetical protein
MILRSVITVSSSATSGKIASNLPAACGAETVTCTRIAPRKEIHLPLQHAANASWWKEENPIPQNYRGCKHATEEMQKRIRREHPGPQRQGCSLPTSPPQACPSQRRSEARQRNSSSLGHIRWHVPLQLNPGSLRPYLTRTAEDRPVSLSSKYKQFVSEQNVESSSNGSTADYDSLMVLC